MKFFFTVFLMSMVLCNEFVSVLDIEMVECNLLDFNFEGELEKEFSENMEDLVKIRFDRTIYYDAENSKPCDESIRNWLIATPYMEIHIPPPETF